MNLKLPTALFLLLFSLCVGLMCPTCYALSVTNMYTSDDEGCVRSIFAEGEPIHVTVTVDCMALTSSGATFNWSINPPVISIPPTQVGETTILNLPHGSYDISVSIQVANNNPGGPPILGANGGPVNAKVFRLKALKVLDDTAVKVKQGTDPQLHPGQFATVKGTPTVQLVAVLDPEVAPPPGTITWQGGIADPGSQKKRTVSTQAAAKTVVTVTVGAVNADLTVWVIWAELTIRIAGKVSADNDAVAVGGVNGLRQWVAVLGGGDKLGEDSKVTNPNITNSFTLGKIEARAMLTPAGVESILGNKKWEIRRKRRAVFWDNGGWYRHPNPNAPHLWVNGLNPDANPAIWKDDTSPDGALDVHPTSGGSVGVIYDVDAPGCPSVLPMNFGIQHTSETYVNFVEAVFVDLSGFRKCSDERPWSYEARVDLDIANPAQRVTLNKLRDTHIQLPQVPHFQHRLPD